MTRYIKLDDQLYFIVLDAKNASDAEKVLQNYSILHSFFIDYDNLEIKSLSTMGGDATYICFFTPHLRGNEVEVTLTEDSFLRPTNKEPFIRGLYSSVFRLGRNNLIGLKVLDFLGDKRLCDDDSPELMAKECVFYHKKRFTEGLKIKQEII